MIDVHCHLNFHSFKKDYDEVIKKAFDDGVEKIINVGTSIESSQKAIELAKKYENLYAIVGVHPHHADKITPGWEKELENMVLQSRIPLRGTKNKQSLRPDGLKKVVGIGETGIDYYSYKSNAIVDPEIQKKVFRNQIELSIKLKLPLQIHNRLAGKDIIEVLKNYKSELLSPPGMFHCMSGNIEFLKSVLDLGFYVGFDGNITYEGKALGEDTPLSELVSYSPIDRIVTETDSPFLTPVPYRGSRNTPSYVILVGNFIGKIKAISDKIVRENTVKNAGKIFKL